MNIFEKLGLVLKFRTAQKALEREAKMGSGFDIQTTLKKGGAALIQGLLAVLLAATIGYLADADVVRAALREGGLSDVLVGALVPLIVAGARMAGNWMKHKDDTAADAHLRVQVEQKIEAQQEARKA